MPTDVPQEDADFHVEWSEAASQQLPFGLLFPRWVHLAFLQSLGTSLSLHDLSKVNAAPQGHQAAPSAPLDAAQLIVWMFMG